MNVEQPLSWKASYPLLNCQLAGCVSCFFSAGSGVKLLFSLCASTRETAKLDLLRLGFA